MTMSEIIFDYMPPKPVTDRLIARFFRGKEPAWCMYPPDLLCSLAIMVAELVQYLIPTPPRTLSRC